MNAKKIIILIFLAVLFSNVSFANTDFEKHAEKIAENLKGWDHYFYLPPIFHEKDASTMSKPEIVLEVFRLRRTVMNDSSVDEYFNFLDQISDENLDYDDLLLSIKDYGSEIKYSDLSGMKVEYAKYYIDTFIKDKQRVLFFDYVDRNTMVHVSGVYKDPTLDWEYVFLKRVFNDDLMFGEQTYRYTFQGDKLIMMDKGYVGYGWIRDKDIMIERMKSQQYVTFNGEDVEYLLSCPMVYSSFSFDDK